MIAKPAKSSAEYGGSDPTLDIVSGGNSPSGGVTLTQKLKAVSRWREQYNPLRRLTMQRAVQWLEDYNRGWMADLQWAYFFIEQTDPDLFAILDRRIGRLLEMDWTAKVTAGATKNKNLADEQMAMITERFSNVDNLYDAIEHMESATFRGFAHCEKWYDDQGELCHLEIVDQWNAVRDGLRGGWKYNPQALQTAYFGLGDELIMDPARFLYREVRRPINRVGLIKFLRANLGEKDWDSFMEIYGIPGGVLVGPPNVPTDKAAIYEEAARSIAEGGSGYAPNGSEWKPNRAPTGTSPFKERLDWLSEKLVLVGTGGLLTMLARSGSGTLAGNAHAEVFEQIAKADARRISETMNKQLVTEMLDEEFPGQPALAYFELSANEETKVGDVVAQISQLGQGGYVVDPAEIKEKTGYTVTLAPKPVAPESENDGEDPDADPDAAAEAKVQNRRIRNRATSAAAAGREAIFKANAAAQELAGRRSAFKPIAERLAAIHGTEDPKAFMEAVGKLKTDSATLNNQVIGRAPDLADAVHQIIGTALLGGMAEHAQEAKTGAKTAK